MSADERGGGGVLSSANLSGGPVNSSVIPLILPQIEIIWEHIQPG